MTATVHDANEILLLLFLAFFSPPPPLISQPELTVNIHQVNNWKRKKKTTERQKKKKVCMFWLQIMKILLWPKKEKKIKKRWDDDVSLT